MHIIKLIHDTRCVVQILDGTFAILIAMHIDNVHGRTSSAIVNSVARKCEIVFAVTAEKRNFATGFGEHVFDKRARKPDASIVTLDRACFYQDFDPRWRGVRKANSFKRIKCGRMDFLNICVRKWLVRAALHACADWADIIGKRGCAKSLTGGAAARTARAD